MIFFHPYPRRFINFTFSPELRSLVLETGITHGIRFNYGEGLFDFFLAFFAAF